MNGQGYLAQDIAESIDVAGDGVEMRAVCMLSGFSRYVQSPAGSRRRLTH